MMLDLKNKEIEKLAKEYNLKLHDKDILINDVVEKKRLARNALNKDYYEMLRKEEIHHRAERQMFVQFLADLEALDIAIEDK